MFFQTVVEISVLDAGKPACAISRCAEIIFADDLEVSAAQKVNVDFGLPVLDIVGNVADVLLVGGRFDDSPFRDADGDVVGKFDQPVKAL